MHASSRIVEHLPASLTFTHSAKSQVQGGLEVRLGGGQGLEEAGPCRSC